MYDDSQTHMPKSGVAIDTKRIRPTQRMRPRRVRTQWVPATQQNLLETRG